LHLKDRKPIFKPLKFNTMENKIYKKIFKLQSEIGTILKTNKNPFFRSEYFDINALVEVLQPLLKKHELVLLQPIIDGAVNTIISDLEGNSIVSVLPLPLEQEPQKVGSAITYYRRYSLVSLLGLRAEDDDGNSTQGISGSGNVFNDAMKHLKSLSPQERPMVLENIRKKKGSQITPAQYKKLEAIK